MTRTALDRLENATGEPTARLLASGDGWQVSDVLCHAGPLDRPFEERHDRVSIAAVVEGSFRYRSSAGTALLTPGAILLGNAGTCYECGHDHSTGDRCVAFHYSPDAFGEIAASVAGSSRFRFPAAMLSVRRELAFAVAEAQVAGALPSPAALEELAIRFAEGVIATLAGTAALPQPRVSSRDERRMSAVLRHIEERLGDPLDLTVLAGIVGMSKYHFLRTFRRTVGVTPYQFLLGMRLRQAAVALRRTPATVAAIAYDAGCGDLSTFNAHFRRAFGVSPTAFRAGYRTVATAMPARHSVASSLSGKSTKRPS
jgi:AraC-like DNA-binding protein